MAERRGGGPGGEPSGDPPATGAPPDESPAIGETVVEPSQDVPSTIAPRSLISNTYRVEALIATGGMGEVYRARNVEMDTLHAVKTIKPEFAGDQRIIDLFRREAKVLRDLRSDVIVGNDGVIRDEADRVYLVMEYIEGESLSAVLERGPLPPVDVRRLRDRLAKGLAAAHDNDVIHRDMSPDNVILQHGRLDRAKIIDFGIAKLVNPGAVTVLGAEFAGKYAFASPEQLDPAESTVDARSDIYSLGLVLAAMAAGKPLDMGTSLTSVVESRKTVPDLSAVPSELHDELAAMLQPDPADRPQSMRDLLTPDQDEGPKWRLMAAAAIAAAVAVAIAVDVFWPRPPDRPAIGDAIDRALSGFICASLTATLTEALDVSVAGFVSSADDIRRLRSKLMAVDGVAGVTDLPDVRPWPFCQAIGVIETQAGLDAGQSGKPIIEPNNPSLVYSEGESLLVSVAATTLYDGYLYVDFIDKLGDIDHLLPSSDRGDNHLAAGEAVRLGGAKYVIRPPFGTDMIVAIATPTPLFAEPRPDTEPASAYLQALSEALTVVANQRLAQPAIGSYVFIISRPPE
ncbi:MAG: serine/threonine-protein kinase [Alphaproteobacteria bacterium]